MVDFRRIALFCLEKLLSKHKLLYFLKIWRSMALLATPWLRLCPQPCQRKKKLIHTLFGEIKAFKTKLKFSQRQICQYVFDIFSVFAKCTWRRWKWHTDAEYADEIVKLQREFDRQFQDFHNLESGIKFFSILFEFDVESVSIDVQMEQWLWMVRAHPKGESIYFQGMWALTRFRTRKFWLINLPKNTFVFTAYLKSGGLTQRTIT